MVSIVIGAQWGDEGKGKIVDLLSKKSDYTVRFHGGNNAGHTVINKYGTFKMHLIPSGIFSSRAVIANGVVLDLPTLIQEMTDLKKAGIKLKKRLFISQRCHLIMPYHRILDKILDEAKGSRKTATTGRGIGPVHSDKVSYNGIRITDLLNKPIFEEKLGVALTVKNKVIKALGEKELDFKEINKQFSEYGEIIKPYITETYTLLNNAIKQNKNILFEGAHGIFLDNDWGTYPFVSASSILPSNIAQGAGVNPKYLKNIIAVAKAYATRVDNGECPVPTEITGELGNFIREKGHEYGATTGRPRRIAWFDVELLKFAKEITGFNQLAVTKIDMLTNLPKIKLCTGYRLNGKKINYIDVDAEALRKVTPIYEEFDSWSQDLSKIRKYQNLPRNAKKYIERIEKLVGVKAKYISVGAEREATIIR